jgi:hemolysin activation/secretion protein
VAHQLFNFAKLALGLFVADTFVAACLPTLPASAQAPGALSPGVQLRELSPGVQLREQLRESTPSAPNYRPPEDIIPTDNSSDEILDDTSSEETQTFFFKAIRINGNEEISSGILSQPFLPFIGKEITFEQLKLAVSQAESIYKNQGFITSKVILPRQDIQAGNVYVQVIEGFIEDIEVKGATTGLQAYFLKMLQPVVNEGPSTIFNFKILERQLLQIRNFGGVDFRSNLVQGSKLGASKLIVDLDTNSFAGGIRANNNLSKQLGTWQISANAQYISPTSQPIKFTGSGSYSFPYSGGLVTGLGLISTPLGNKGFQADALWSASSTSSKDLLDGPGRLQTVGQSNYWSFGISYPIILKRNSQLSISLSGTGQDSTNDLYIDGSQVTDLSTDKIRAVRLGVDGYYASPRSTNSVSFRLSQGISGLNDGLSSDEVPSNLYGDSGFTTARLNLSRTQKIFDAGTLFTLKGTGQLSSTPVPVPETFTYGGPLYGRAFNSVYLLGDQGWAASAEISQPFNFSVFNSASTLSPFAWYDYGNTEYKEGPLPTQSASTYGLGLRLNAFNTDLELGWGIPASNTLNDDLVGIGNSILYFNTGWRF